jgi:5-dehydro-4-deoxyglucarate dehydratase
VIMTTPDMKLQLRGVLGFPVTPFHNDLSVDLDALEENVDHMASHAFCAIVAAGGSGEIYSLSPEEIVAVVRVAVKTVRGRMPVIAGVGFNSTISATLAQQVENAGADALLVMPPYYMNAPPDGLLSYYRAVGSSSSLPMIVYDRDWINFLPDAVAKLTEMVPALFAWKDGHGDTRKYQRIMNRIGDRLAWLGGAGDDCAINYFAIGVQAYTSSISNIAPALSVALALAGLKRNFAEMNELTTRFVHPLYAIRERRRGYEVAVMKHAMEILGKKAGPVRPPLQNCTEIEIEEVRRIMDIYRNSTFLSSDQNLAGTPVISWE